MWFFVHFPKPSLVSTVWRQRRNVINPWLPMVRAVHGRCSGFDSRRMSLLARFKRGNEQLQKYRSGPASRRESQQHDAWL
jgi:hypothetical protein